LTSTSLLSIRAWNELLQAQGQWRRRPRGDLAVVMMAEVWEMHDASGARVTVAATTELTAPEAHRGDFVRWHPHPNARLMRIS
jgi:hypothetical protein